MGWIAPDTSTTRWLKRLPITINNVAAAASPQDVNIDLSGLGDYFWTNLQGTSGHGLRLTQADGRTAIDFERTGWNSTTRTGILEANQIVLNPATIGMVKAWIYFDSTNTSVSDGSTTQPAPSSPLTGSVTDPFLLSGPMVKYAPQRVGATAPRMTVTKGSTEIVWIWWDFGAMLGRYGRPSSGATVYEELQHVRFQVLRSGADQAALYLANETRFFGNGLVRTSVQAGSSGTDYTPSVTVTTSLDRKFNARCLLKVQDVDEQ